MYDPASARPLNLFIAFSHRTILRSSNLRLLHILMPNNFLLVVFLIIDYPTRISKKIVGIDNQMTFVGVLV